VFDYTIHAGTTAIVFATERANWETLKGLKRPLVPGIALMREALNKVEKRREDTLVFLAAKTWIEGALFIQGATAAHAAGFSHTDVMEPLSAQMPLPEKAVLITGDIEADHPSIGEIKKLFPAIRVIPLEDLWTGHGFKRLGIFKYENPNAASPIRRRRTALVSFGVLLSLFTLLSVVSSRMERRLVALTRIRTQDEKDSGRAAELEAAIAALERQIAGNASPSYTDPYQVIEAIHHALDGGWIRSLTMDERSFSFEAEGADSISTINKLKAAEFIENISIRQAAASPAKGELFSVSGGIVHGVQ
jgi:hypothetical protein